MSAWYAFVDIQLDAQRDSRKFGRRTVHIFGIGRDKGIMNQPFLTCLK